MAKQKKCPDCPPVGAPEYMATYGDMMTLLVTFFVLLISYSSMQEAKFSSAMISIRGALGVMKASATSKVRPQVTPFFDSKTGEIDYDIKQIIEQLDEETKKSGTHENVKITYEEGKIHFRISTPMLYSSGNANLKESSFKALDLIAKVLEKSSYEIRIEGHTDNVPIHTAKFPSNWELSTERAMSIVRRFVNQNVSPERFQVIGYGEYRPISTNETPKGRELNRRVEIYVNLKKEKSSEIDKIMNLE
ncbi:MAG: OmpA family protein [Candidatus Cloacimonadota bacterium]|nr:OmpA family protein [Candidatus Cloacimonadota bacterium]